MAYEQWISFNIFIQVECAKGLTCDDTIYSTPLLFSGYEIMGYMLQNRMFSWWVNHSLNLIFLLFIHEHKNLLLKEQGRFPRNLANRSSFPPQQINFPLCHFHFPHLLYFLSFFLRNTNDAKRMWFSFILKKNSFNEFEEKLLRWFELSIRRLAVHWLQM